MRRCHITVHDLEEAIRQHGHAPEIEKVEAAYLERNGNISVIMKEKERRPATNRPPESP